ncbi:MAG: hypothetical protein ACXWP5_10010, partial [Bdellovibrionota bacterium]
MIWVVAHDSGGAEILSAWVKRNAGEHFRFVLEGPALKVFERKLPDVSVATRADLESADPKADWILTGTGWASDLEFEAIRIARRKGVRVVSFLDHWVNYIERFTRKGLVSLPDEIWVGDEDALKIAKERFQTRVAIRLEPNPYFDEIREELKKVTKSGGASSKSGIRILYVCEALS